MPRRRNFELRYAPVIWASYLLHGETEGFEEREREACDQWLTAMDLGNPYEVYALGNMRDYDREVMRLRPWIAEGTNQPCAEYRFYAGVPRFFYCKKCKLYHDLDREQCTSEYTSDALYDAHPDGWDEVPKPPRKPLKPIAEVIRQFHRDNAEAVNRATQVREPAPARAENARRYWDSFQELFEPEPTDVLPAQVALNPGGYRIALEPDAPNTWRVELAPDLRSPVPEVTAALAAWEQWNSIGLSNYLTESDGRAIYYRCRDGHFHTRNGGTCRDGAPSLTREQLDAHYGAGQWVAHNGTHI